MNGAVGGVTEGVGGGLAGASDPVAPVTDVVDQATGTVDGAVGALTTPQAGSGVTSGAPTVPGAPPVPSAGVAPTPSPPAGAPAAGGGPAATSAPAAPGVPAGTGAQGAGGLAGPDPSGLATAPRARGAAARGSAAVTRPGARQRKVPRRVYERRLRRSVARYQGCFYALSGLERRVLSLRGGSVGEPRSRRQVARRLDIDAGRVRASEHSGLRTLRHADRESGCSGASSPARGAIISASAVAGGQAGGPGAALFGASSVRRTAGTRRADSDGTGDVAGERESGPSVLDRIRPDLGPIGTTGERFPLDLALLVALALAGAFVLIVVPRLTRPNR